MDHMRTSKNIVLRHGKTVLAFIRPIIPASDFGLDGSYRLVFGKGGKVDPEHI